MQILVYEVVSGFRFSYIYFVCVAYLEELELSTSHERTSKEKRKKEKKNTCRLIRDGDELFLH